MRVRRAVAADAAGIAAVHLSSWRVAYRDDAPAGWLDAQTLGGRTDVWRDRLAAPVAGPTLVAVASGGELIGFCGLATPSGDDGAAPDTAQISTLYVEPSRWRLGAGRALMEAAIDALAADGYAAVTLWVLDTNARALAFYATFGFADDGGRLEQDAWPTQLRMRRAL